MAQADSPTDADIVAQVIAGQQAAYRLVVERHQRAVFNAAYRLLGQPDEAADITQDTFLRAYQALATFQTDKPLAPWLCRIAINLSLNQLKRRKVSVSLDDDHKQFDLPDSSTEPQAQLLQAEQHNRLRQAILALPPEQRIVIELRHFQGQSYDEMAATLDLSLSNVKSRLFRARKRLKEILTQGEYND